MNPANHRARLLLDLFHLFVLPTLVLSLLLSLFPFRTAFLSIPLHLVFIFIWVTLKVAYSELWHDRQAKSLGAKRIPRVVGKWPGNLDILFRMMRAFSTSYVLDVYLQLFEEYQCTTLNLRILWINNVGDLLHSLLRHRWLLIHLSMLQMLITSQIISMDQEHSKFVLATGFQHFWRGNAQKERMSVL